MKYGPATSPDTHHNRASKLQHIDFLTFSYSRIHTTLATHPDPARESPCHSKARHGQRIPSFPGHPSLYALRALRFLLQDGLAAAAALPASAVVGGAISAPVPTSLPRSEAPASEEPVAGTAGVSGAASVPALAGASLSDLLLGLANVMVHMAIRSMPWPSSPGAIGRLLKTYWSVLLFPGFLWTWSWTRNRTPTCTERRKPNLHGMRLQVVRRDHGQRISLLHRNRPVAITQLLNRAPRLAIHIRRRTCPVLGLGHTSRLIIDH